MPRAESTHDLEAAARAASAGKRVLVRHAGARLAVVPAADLQRLEELEDAAEARAALAEFAGSGEDAVPAEEVRRRLR